MKQHHYQLTILVAVVTVIGTVTGFRMLAESSKGSEVIAVAADTEIVKETHSPAPEKLKIEMSAKHWEFSKELLTVHQGQEVELTITTEIEEGHDDGHGHSTSKEKAEHTFTIPELGIHQELIPGETVTIAFIASEKGSFTFFCRIPCGNGHERMRGILNII